MARIHVLEAVRWPSLQAGEPSLCFVITDRHVNKCVLCYWIHIEFACSEVPVRATHKNVHIISLWLNPVTKLTPTQSSFFFLFYVSNAYYILCFFLLLKVWQSLLKLYLNYRCFFFLFEVWLSRKHQATVVLTFYILLLSSLSGFPDAEGQGFSVCQSCRNLLSNRSLNRKGKPKKVWIH